MKRGGKRAQERDRGVEERGREGNRESGRMSTRECRSARSATLRLRSVRAPLTPAPRGCVAYPQDDTRRITDGHGEGTVVDRAVLQRHFAVPCTPRTQHTSARLRVCR